MKKQHIITLACSALFVALFYQHAPALNTLIFSIIIATGLFLHGQVKPKAVLAAFIFSAICVYVYGNALSIITCFIFFIILAGKLSFNHLPVSFSILPGFLKLMSAFPMQVTRIISYKKNAASSDKSDERTTGILLKFSLVAAALFIFIVLYANASSGFSMVLDSLAFDIPNFEFWFMLLMSCFISHAIFYQHGKSLLKYLVPSLNEKLEAPAASKQRNSWLSVGKLMFAALSLLAIVVLCSDLYFIISGSVGRQDPAFYSRLVHEGVGALMFSIFIAIVLLIVFFEGRINFLSGNASAKTWAYVWIFCNMAMILITYYKNSLYVETSGLTYRRIGVWYYLLACGIVLSFVFLKIRNNMNFLHLLRRSCAFGLTILLISAFIPWEFTVTSFNIRQAEKQGKLADTDYLMSLDGHNLHLVDAYVKRQSIQKTVFGQPWNPSAQPIIEYQSQHRQKHVLDIPLSEYYSMRKLQEQAHVYPQ